MTLYRKFDTNVLNPKQKKLNWFNRNYFYLATILIIGGLCATFFLLGDFFKQLVQTDFHWNLIVGALRHSDIGHLVGSLITFGVVSIFLERHFGSIKYFLLVAFSIPLAAVATFAVSGNWEWFGFSSVSYFLFAIFGLTILFGFKTYFCGKVRWIFPTIILGIILLINCWQGNGAEWPQIYFEFGVFTNLISNLSHWSACICGAVAGLFARMFVFQLNPKQKSILKNDRDVVMPRKDVLMKKSKENMKARRSKKK